MSDLNDNREGGLFSDDYEIPKRENPYKKKKKTEDSAAAYVPTEDKPLEIKRENPYKRKTATPVKDQAATQESESREAPPTDESHAFRDSDGTHLAKHEKPLRERWNDFIFSHVKLICFIGGVFVVLLFIAAPAIYYGVQDAREQAEQEAKDPLTMNYVKGLADKSEPITWSDFTRFYYEEQITSTGVSWRVSVGDGDRYLIIIGGANTRTLPDDVTLYDFHTNDKVDLTQGLMALEAFLEGRE